MRLFVSDYSSLLFRPYVDVNESDTLFIQNFAYTDKIRVQARANKAVRAVVKDLNTGQFEDLPVNTYPADEVGRYYFYDWAFGKEIGEYEFIIALPNDINNVPLISSRFNVVDEKCLENTVRIRYAHNKNSLDGIFITPDKGSPAFGMQKYFDIRFKGGFLNRENEYNSETEHFRNQNLSLGLISGLPYKVKRLTIGDENGVPDWVGDKLARIFSLQYTTINDDGYKLAEAGEIEKEAVGADPMRIFKVSLEPDIVHWMKVETGIEIYTSNKYEPYIDEKGDNLYIQNR